MKQTEKVLSHCDFRAKLHFPVTKVLQSNQNVSKALADEFSMGFCAACIILLAPKYEVYYTRLGHQIFT